MASTWGLTWGLAWGNTWGDVIELPEEFSGGYFDFEKLYPRRRLQKVEKESFKTLLKELRSEKDAVSYPNIPDDIKKQISSVYKPYYRKRSGENLNAAELTLAVMQLREVREEIELRILQDDEELILILYT